MIRGRKTVHPKKGNGRLPRMKTKRQEQKVIHRKVEAKPGKPEVGLSGFFCPNTKVPGTLHENHQNSLLGRSMGMFKMMILMKELGRKIGSARHMGGATNA